MTNVHSGSDFDGFLQEEGLLADVEATAIKRVVAYQIEQEMQRHGENHGGKRDYGAHRIGEAKQFRFKMLTN